MNTLSILRAVVIVFSVGLLIQSCQVAGPPGPGENPTITYTVTGGFVGGLHTKLVIRPTGTATLETTYPQLELQLSTAEYSRLLGCFNDFTALQDTFPNSCMDGFIFTIEMQGDDYSKRVSIDQCTLFDRKDSDAAVAKINTILIALDSLARRVYEARAPWVGLTADYSIDSNTYGIAEPITMHYRISNPTQEDRAIYFQRQSQFWFSVYRTNFPGFNYFYPPTLYTDSSASTEIHLGPGETKEITYTWDQHVRVRSVDSILAVGSYRLVMGITAGALPSNVFSFDVVDRSIPISGVITPDPNGEQSGSSTYTFALTVWNWSESAVTLHFPSSNAISVELYDLGGLTSPDSLIYSSPAATGSAPFELTLSPRQVRTFSIVANKSEFRPWYMWTYAKIRLLCSDFGFVRDGELSIFPYVKPSASRSISRSGVAYGNDR